MEKKAIPAGLGEGFQQGRHGLPDASLAQQGRSFAADVGICRRERGEGCLVILGGQGRALRGRGQQRDFPALFPQPVDGAQHVGFGQLGGGATQFVPTARVDDEHAPVRVLNHIRGVEIRVIAEQEITIICPVAGSLRMQGVAADLAQIELAHEEIASITDHATGGGGTKMGHRRHQGSGAGMAGQDIVVLAPDAAMHGVDQAIALPAAGMLEKGAVHDQIAFRGPGEADRIVHACREDRFDVFRTLRARGGPEDMGRRGGPPWLAGQVVGLRCKGSFAPVELSVRACIRAVQVIGTTGQGFPIKPDVTLLRDPVAISIGEFPDLGRSRHVKRAFMPEAALREHQVFCEHGALVEDPIAIGVGQPQHAVRLFFQLLGGGLIAAGGFGQVEPSLVIKTGFNRPFHKGWEGRFGQGIVIRKSKCFAAQGQFGGRQSGGPHENSQGDDGFGAGHVT